MPRLLFFTSVVLKKIPRRKILKSLDGHSISLKDLHSYMKLRTITEKNIYKLQHLLSLLDKVLMKQVKEEGYG